MTLIMMYRFGEETNKYCPNSMLIHFNMHLFVEEKNQYVPIWKVTNDQNRQFGDQSTN